MEPILYLHGDLALVKIDKLPEDLPEKATTKILIRGSNNNPHQIDNGEVYFKKVDQYVFGYLVAKNTTLYHCEHGEKTKGRKLKSGLKKAKILDGIYELRNQFEETPEGMQIVKD